MMNNTAKNVLLIFLLSLNLRLGISSIAPIMDLLSADLLISNTQVSLLSNIPVICMGCFAFLVGIIQRKISRRSAITLLMVLIGLSMLARYIVDTYLGFLLTAVLIGFAVAIIGPFISSFIKENFQSSVGTMIAVYTLGMGLGTSIVSATVFDIAEQTSWQTSLSVWGALSLVSALLWQIFAPAEQHSRERSKADVSLGDKKLWYMVIFFGAQSGLYYVGMTWLSPYLISTGLEQQTSNIYLSLFAALQVIFSFVLPVFINRIGKLKEGLYACLAIALAGILGLLYLPSMTLISIILTSVGLSVLFTVALTFPVLFSKNAAQASVSTGYVQMFGYIIGGILPIAIGKVIDLTTNYQAIWYISLALLAVVFLSAKALFKEGKTT